MSINEHVINKRLHFRILYINKINNSAYHCRLDGNFDQRKENASKSTGKLVLLRN